MRKFCPIIMGSGKDLYHAENIKPGLDKFGIEYALRIASAHKHPDYLRRIVQEYEKMTYTTLAYVTVAGGQDALTNTLAGMTIRPVVACPPNPTDADILSSLHRPSGITASLVLRPEDVGLQIAKYMAMDIDDIGIAELIRIYQIELRDSIEAADRKIRRFDQEVYVSMVKGANGRAIVLLGRLARIHGQYLRGMMPDADYVEVTPDNVLAVTYQNFVCEGRGAKKVIIVDTGGRDAQVDWHVWSEEVHVVDIDKLAEELR